MSLTYELGQFVEKTSFNDIPKETIEAQKKSVLDNIGNILGASGIGEGSAIILFPYDDRGYKAVFFDAFHKLFHIFVVSNLKRMIRKLINLVNGKIIDLWKVFFLLFADQS